MKIGAQFYTLRDHCGTLEDFSETLRRVADIGYTEVQISGVCAYTPQWLDEELKKNGLRCVLTHTDPNRISREPLAVCEDHKVFGCSYIGVGCMPGGVNDETYAAFVRDFRPAAKALREQGCTLFYHNHHWEFGNSENGQRFLDRLLTDFPADLLSVTLDTYWAQFGGADPAAVIERLKGRGECIHLKDMIIAENEQRMTAVGDGNLNFDRILAAAEAVGTEHLLVEQDHCYGKDPFEELARSYRYLKSLGLN